MADNMEARVAELERKLGVVVGHWNAFIDPNAGGVTRPRIAELERRLNEMVATWNESLDARAKARSGAKQYRDALQKALDELAALGQDLAERVKALDERAMRYQGVYQRALKYRKADCVTADGSLWVSLRGTENERPGQSDAWILVAKGGMGK